MSYMVAPFRRGLGECTPAAGTDVCFDVTGTARADGSLNTTTLLDPGGWFALDRGAPTGVIGGGARSGAGSSSFTAWLNDNALKVGLGIVVAGILFGVARK